MILGVSRLATMRAIVHAKHSPKRNVGDDELLVLIGLSRRPSGLRKTNNHTTTKIVELQN